MSPNPLVMHGDAQVIVDFFFRTKQVVFNFEGPELAVLRLKIYEHKLGIITSGVLL